MTLRRARDRKRLDPRLPAGHGRDPPRRRDSRGAGRAARRRHRAALRRAGRARAGPRHRAAPTPGRRKIVLATSIAETSLTIEGVRVVIDSGLMRVPVYEPDVGLTRLETVRVSRANADQRRGRAGRIEPGVCYRLWEEAATGGLQPYAAPEILSADLSGFALDCALWGVADPATLAFLDPPPRAALAEARALLTAIGALDGDGRITDEGRAISRLALPPRLARMVVDAARAGDARTASEVAVVLDRARARRRRGRSRDPARGLPPRPLAARRRREAARAGAGGRRALTPNPSPRGRGGSAPFSLREKVAGEAGRMRVSAPCSPPPIPIASPSARGRRGEFLMANGRAAALEAHDALAGEPFLAIGEIAGRAASARILLAAPLSLDEIERVAGASIETMDELTFDRASASLAGAPPPPARRARSRRADACGPARRGGGAGAGARRPFAWASRACRGPRRSSSGATGSCFCAAPRARRGRTSRTRRSPPIPAGSRRSSWARPGSTRSAPTISPGRSARCLPWDLARRLDDEAPTHFRAPTGTAGADRLRGRGRPVDCAARAGTVRAQRASVAGRRAHSAHPRASFARPSPDPDHARPAGLLARLVGRRPRRPPRPLSPPFLARGPRRRRADRAGEAAGDVRARRAAVTPP